MIPLTRRNSRYPLPTLMAHRTIFNPTLGKHFLVECSSTFCAPTCCPCLQCSVALFEAAPRPVSALFPAAELGAAVPHLSEPQGTLADPSGGRGARDVPNADCAWHGQAHRHVQDQGLRDPTGRFVKVIRVLLRPSAGSWVRTLY